MAIKYLASAALGTAVGPFSHATVACGLIFVSGQAGFTADGQLAPDIEGQTRQTLANVSTVLAAGGATLASVVRCGVYLSDIRHFDRMNAVYREVFGDALPARTTVEVAALPFPGLLIEIDAIAVEKD